MWRDYLIAAFTILGGFGSSLILYLVRRLGQRFDHFQAQITSCRERLAALEEHAYGGQWNGRRDQ